jgi:VanZ family protein
MKRSPWTWLPAGCLMGLIFALSSMTDPPTPLRFAHADKVVHGGMYAGLAAAYLFAGLPPAWAGAAASAYGATDELHQRCVPGRDSSAGDWAADTVGAAAAAAAAWAWRRRRS